MESIAEILELLEERRALCTERCAESERNQIAKYNELTKRLKTVKDETTFCKENISKNLKLLRAHKCSIDNLVHDSKPVSCLQISQEAHRETVALFTEGSQFLNNLQNVHEVLENNNKEYDIDLMTDTTTCTNSIETGLSNARSLMAQTETLKQYADMLQERYASIEGGFSFQDGIGSIET